MRLMVVLALLIGVAGTVDAGCTLNTLPASSYAASSTSYEVTTGACLSCAPAPVAYAPAAVDLSMYCAPRAALYATPTSYMASFQAPVYRTHLVAAPIQRTFVASSYASAPAVFNRTVVQQNVYTDGGTRFLGPPVRQGAFGGLAVSPGGFRAGFAGQGLNSRGGAGFLTGGGLLGGAANLLGVSSAGLEGAALGILATRSNLFGLARRR